MFLCLLLWKIKFSCLLYDFAEFAVDAFRFPRHKNFSLKIFFFYFIPVFRFSGFSRSVNFHMRTRHFSIFLFRPFSNFSLRRVFQNSELLPKRRWLNIFLKLRKLINKIFYLFIFILLIFFFTSAF